MIIVAGHFKFTPGHDDAIRAAMIDMMNESAKEDGCHHYRFYRDVEDPSVYHVYEEWESDAHLAAHAASAHMKVFRGKLGEIGVEMRDVSKREGGEATKI
ncbi:MAG: antibiotic biosynthesis monooxygenase [Pseudomonadota bacterium]